MTNAEKESRSVPEAAASIRVKLDSPYGFWRYAGPDDDRRLLNGHAGTFVATALSAGTIVDWDGIGELATPSHWVEFDA